MRRFTPQENKLFLGLSTVLIVGRSRDFYSVSTKSVYVVYENVTMSTTPLPPGMRLELESLFKLFADYSRARSTRQRSRIEAQIMEVFSRLGVASDSIVLRQASEMFDQIRKVPGITNVRTDDVASRAKQLVSARVRDFERRPNAPKLSLGARQMLRIPVVEAAQASNRLDAVEVSRSLDTVLDSLTEPPRSPVEGTDRGRTSIAVVRAFWKNFCHIPPFCSGEEQR